MGIGYSTLKQWIYQGRSAPRKQRAGITASPMRSSIGLMARRAPARASKTQPPKATGPIVALSGRNQLRGFVEEVLHDGLVGQGAAPHRRSDF